MGISVLSPLTIIALCLSGGRDKTHAETTRDLKARAMPKPSFDKSKLPPHFEEHHCPSCGLPMEIVRAEPTDDVDCENRVFECVTCIPEQTKTVKVRFREGQLLNNTQIWVMNRF